MQYELYIDVFFLVNFVMDYLMLQIARKALKCTATHGNVIAGALTGAFVSCIVVCISAPALVKTVCMHVLVNTSMVMIGLKIREKISFLKALALIYLAGFLLGGIMTWLGQYLGGYLRISFLFFAIVIFSYFLSSRSMDFLESLWKLKKHRCEVTLYREDRTCRVNAIVDSGNGLFDSLTGKPVHIIGEKAAKKLFEGEKIQRIRYIPYHTIQENESVLPCITIDKMLIHGEEEKLVVSPLLGISGQHLFGNGTCEMILHPDDC